MRRVGCAVLALGVALGVTGCDPCAGVGSCSRGPRLAVEGSLVEHVSGVAMRGARVDFIRTGGVELDQDSVSTIADGNGYWRAVASAREGGVVIADINVTSDFGSYRVRGVRLETTDRHGDGQVLPPWVVNPHFSYAAELYYRGLGDKRVDNAVVVFRRTSGIGFVVGVEAGDFAWTTGATGRIPMFAIYAHGVTLGELIGEMIVHLPSPFAPDTIRGIRLLSTQVLQTPAQVNRIAVGPSLLNVGEVHERRSGKPAPGVPVVFRRTGGVATDIQSFNATTDANGRFLFSLRPLGEGPVIGDFEFRPSLGSPVTIKGARVDPHRDDRARFYRVFDVGPALPWAGLVLMNGVGIPNIESEFHRTGGIRVEPSDYTGRTDVNGYFHLNPQPQDTGFVEADIVIRPPPPFATIRSHVRLHTVEDDVSGGVIVQWPLERQSSALSRKTDR